MERKNNNIGENHYNTQSTTTLFRNEEEEETKQSDEPLVTFIGDNWMNSVMAHANHEKKGIT
jgi:hypothetical protein